jgi:hypothetical protein
MLGRFLIAVVLLGGGAGLVVPARAEVVEVRIASGPDDAEQNASGSVSVVGSDLELIWDGNLQTVGLRFPGLAVPRGAEITDAWIQFESDETSSNAVTVTFQAQASDNAPTFTTAAQNISSRPRETAAVAWSPPPWTSTGAAGPEQRTPSLAALVQVVVNRPGWAPGNAIAFIVSGSSSGKRTAATYNGKPSGAALLHVEYSPVEVNQPPLVTILSPVHLTQQPADEPVALVAETSDPEDGVLNNVLWISNRDGFIGQYRQASRRLSVGIHTIRAWVQDSGGLAGSASVEVEVSADGRVLLAAGDIARCNSNGDELTAALLDERFGSVLTLGDNAYNDGTLAQFMTCYDPTWGRHKARTLAATGNHEYHVAGAAGHFEYFGEAAGPPGEGWYSYDLGPWHVVVLNSNCSEVGGCTSTSPQGLWLEADLAANPRACTLAAWHHPRFSSGSSHGSSTATRDLYEIFHRHGGDVVLTGHDHNYERFAPQDAFGVADPTGPVQFVVGTGGGDQRGLGDIEPNSVARAGNLYGLLELTLFEDSYDFRFLPAAGSTYTDSGSASCVTAGPPPNQPPTVTIEAPADGASFEAATSITFSGSASDPEDGDLGASLAWSSDRDGSLGSGGSFTTSALSVGTHQIRASVQDSQGLPALDAIGLDVTAPLRITFEKRIAASADDAEEEDAGSHDVFTGGVDLEMVLDAREQIVGLRFTGLAIPKGARILDAWLQFQADGSTSGATSLTIEGHAVNDAPAFTRTRRDLSDRPRTSASVDWTPASWTSGAQGAAQRSPSLVPIVQELVDRSGWAAGNDVAFLVTGSGLRRAESYDGIRAAAPLLHVEYEPSL